MSTTPFTWQTAAFTGSTQGTILTAGALSSGTIANGNVLGSSGLLVTATIGTQPFSSSSMKRYLAPTSRSPNPKCVPSRVRT